ncbi:MAG TPA: ArsI/CadI family heavy metal resistance metalloenzyme [Acidimicrobiales bacterium]|nr:ArsI/CadI family heavy metal resistance metalloenzyme [Acidimicrobiales bacterium]
MSRVQVALNVTDLGEAIDFYSKLFHTEPAKVRAAYANFAIADPPLKLVLIENADAPAGSLNHLGIEVGSTGEVAAAAARLSSEGLPTATEEQVNCCWAIQDKVWVEGPGGEPWEVYTVLADADSEATTQRATGPSHEACCAGRPKLTHAVASPTPSCR